MEVTPTTVQAAPTCKIVLLKGEGRAEERRREKKERGGQGGGVHALVTREKKKKEEVGDKEDFM